MKLTISVSRVLFPTTSLAVRVLLRGALICVLATAVAAQGETEVERETISTNALISVKPHLQLMGETSVGVVWTTREKADGWVEWSQDGGETWRTAWNQRDGLKVDANDRIHKIVVEGYDPAKPLKYRVRSRAYRFGWSRDRADGCPFQVISVFPVDIEGQKRDNGNDRKRVNRFCAWKPWVGRERI